MTVDPLRVLVLNAGTATLKAAVFDADGLQVREVARGEQPWTADDGAQAVFERLLRTLPENVRHEPDLIAHRVVHGGQELTSTTPISAAVERVIESLTSLAPLHNARSLAVIRAARERMPSVPACAVFDTAFHAGRRAASVTCPLPEGLARRIGALRYGFHGIAHQSLIEAVALAEGCAVDRVTGVSLQLGSGCSACAVKSGRSFETSMSYSPLDGLMMATRCGSMDPTIILALLNDGLSSAQIESALNRQSGLVGVGGDRDMKLLLVAEQAGSERAALAISMFVERIVATAGAYFTLLKGQGVLVFGGGIGANSPQIRARVADGLSCWGVALDTDLNDGAAGGRISAAGSRSVYVFTTDEESLIAREAWATVGAS